MTKGVILTVLLFFSSTCSPLYAFEIDPDNEKDLKASTKEEYELQEKCGKRAAEWGDEWGAQLGGRTYFDKDGMEEWRDFVNHYNRKLNKCFFLLTIRWSLKIMEGRLYVIEKHLYDINENKEYGSFTLIQR